MQHVFVSHSSRDKDAANAVVHALESAGERCWVAPRDVVPGPAYAGQILDAVNGCALLVVLVSSAANASEHVAREVELATRTRRPMMPVRIELVDPSKELTCFLGRAHWLDAVMPPLEAHLERLVESVNWFAAGAVVGSGPVPQPAAHTEPPLEPRPEPRAGARPEQPAARKKRGRGALVGAGLLPAVVAVGVAVAVWPRGAGGAGRGGPGGGGAGAGSAVPSAKGPVTLAEVGPIKIEVDGVRKKAAAVARTPETEALHAGMERAWQAAELFFQEYAFAEAKGTYGQVRVAAEKIEAAEVKRLAVVAEDGREAAEAKAKADAEETKWQAQAARSAAEVSIANLEQDSDDPAVSTPLNTARIMYSNGLSSLASDPGAAKTSFDAARSMAEVDLGMLAAARKEREEARKVEEAKRSKVAKTGDAMVNTIRATMVFIGPGTFTMGTPASEQGRFDDEAQRRVTLTKPFYLGKTEVTQGQWKAVMGNNPSNLKGDDLPVEQVSWDDCVEFCRKLSAKEGKRYRLPTEAEWEYACRAGTTTPFSFGGTIKPAQVNFNGNFTNGGSAKGLYREKPVAAGSLPSNPWGLHEMHGNVWEWCSDWHGAYPEGEARNQTGSEQGSYRVLRGGT